MLAIRRGGRGPPRPPCAPRRAGWRLHRFAQQLVHPRAKVDKGRAEAATEVLLQRVGILATRGEERRVGRQQRGDDRLEERRREVVGQPAEEGDHAVERMGARAQLARMTSCAEDLARKNACLRSRAEELEAGVEKQRRSSAASRAPRTAPRAARLWLSIVDEL